MTRSSDVIIIGAGAVGAAAAYFCARAGLSVRIIDRGSAASGTSSRCEGNILVSDKESGPELELANLSLEILNGELSEYGSSWELEKKGGIIVASQESSLASLNRVVSHQKEHSINVEEIGVEDLTRLEPNISPNAVGAAYYPDDSQVMPIKLVFKLLALAETFGAQFLPHCTVHGFIRDKNRVVGVETDKGLLYANTVINAAGPWSSAVAQLAGTCMPVEPRRGYVMVTEPLPPSVFHKVYAAEYIDNVGSSDAGLQCSPVVEGTPAGTILIGSSREKVGFSEETNYTALSTMGRNALSLFPFLKHVKILRHYFGFRPYSPDHLPSIGPDAAVPGLWHATGHEGAGIGLSVGTGKILAQMLTGQPTSIDSAAFAPARFAHHLDSQEAQ